MSDVCGICAMDHRELGGAHGDDALASTRLDWLADRLKRALQVQGRGVVAALQGIEPLLRELVNAGPTGERAALIDLDAALASFGSAVDRTVRWSEEVEATEKAVREVSRLLAAQED